MNEENEEITFEENLETKEAKKLYKKQKNKIETITGVISLLIFILTIILYRNQTISLLIAIIAMIITIYAEIEINKEYMKKYEEILNTAIHNDQVRHDEKIRIMERRRHEESKNE